MQVKLWKTEDVIPYENNLAWTSSEIEKLREIYPQKPVEKVLKHFERSEAAITAKAHTLGIRSRRMWTKEEEELLEERWGTWEIPRLARYFGKSENAIKLKAYRMGLPAFLESGDYISLEQLHTAVTGSQSGSKYILKSWVGERGLKVSTQKVQNNEFRVVKLKDFWEWAKDNRSFIDFSKFKKHSLGAEPEWVQAQREIDSKVNSKIDTSPWTTVEDQRLKALLKEHKYGYLELSKKLGRTSGAIQRRIVDLGLLERPVKAYNHNKYTADEKERIADMVKDGYPYEMMARELGRSGKALRGYMYRTYGSEALDKARARLKEIENAEPDD